MPDKVKLSLSNPYVDENGKVHDVGSTVTVGTEVAERLVTGGIGVPATMSDAASVPVDVEPASKRK